MRARPVGEFACRPVDWFWLARLAFGKPALLEGDPGLSKSLVALDLCARLSTGRPFPHCTAGLGFDGLQLACWGSHFEGDRALAEPDYCAGRRSLLDQHGLQCWASALVGPGCVRSDR